MKFKKGFTLIELLVVIGVLAVIAAGVVALIDPVDKNRAAQDAKVQSDIGQIATALQAFAASNPAGTYPATLPELVTNGDLTVVPVPPTGYDCGVAGSYNYTPGAAPRVACRLYSKKYTKTTAGGFGANASWVWCASNGRAGATAALATCP